MQFVNHRRTALQYGAFSMKALAKYQVILLGEQRHNRCEQLAQGCCPNNAAVGVEPVTSWSRVQHPTATLPSHLIIVLTSLIDSLKVTRAKGDPCPVPWWAVAPVESAPLTKFMFFHETVQVMLTWNTLDDTLNGSGNQVKACSSADVKSFYIFEYFLSLWLYCFHFWWAVFSLIYGRRSMGGHMSPYFLGVDILNTLIRLHIQGGPN